jgi:hypothetical protein
VYSEHGTIVFPLSFGFSNPQYYYHDETARICPSKGSKPLCLVARLIFPVLDETTSRLDSFQYSLSGIDVSAKAYPKSTLDTIRPGGSIHYRDLMQDIDEWTGRRRRSLVERVKRQVVVTAMAVGAALSYFVPKWFKTDDADKVDSRAVYESLAKKVAESHKTVIQLAKTIPLIEQNFQYSMDSIVEHFQAKYSKLGNQTNDLINSMRTGELRMALIAAHTVQEMNRFSQFFLYSQVINACTNRQLSLLAVNQSSLIGELTKLERNLDPFGFELIFGLKDLSSYYRLKLAQCTVVHVEGGSGSGQISIVLTVPIRRRQVFYSLIEGFTVPFLLWKLLLLVHNSVPSGLITT